MSYYFCKLEILFKVKPMTKSISEEQAFGIIAAPFWKRLAAWLIDQIVLSSVIILSFFALVGVSDGFLGTIKAFSIEITQVSIIVNLGYFTVPEGVFGQTLGKRALNIFVYGESGDRVGFASAILRRIGLAIPILGIIDAGAILLTSKDQRIFDILAATVVLKGGYREEGVRFLQGEDITEALVDKGALVKMPDFEEGRNQKVLAKLEERKEELRERYESGKIEKDQYLRLKDKYDARIKALEENL